MQRGAPAAYGGGAATGRAINSPAQMLELHDLLRAEIEVLVNENKNYRALRDEFERKVQEQVNDLQQMEQNLIDLDRKHRAMKEQYENEIRRLKGQPPAPSSVAGASAATGALPSAGTAAGNAAPTTASLPAYLPGVLTGPPPHAPTHATAHGHPLPPTAARIAPPPPAPAVATAPLQAPPAPPQQQPPGNLLGISALAPPSGPPGGPPHGASRNPALKKEPNRPVAANTAFPQSQQPQQEEDYVVLQGRTTSNTPGNMKVGLQNSLTHDSVVCCVRYSWDGQYLATGSNRAAQLYEVTNGRVLAKFAKEDVPQLEDGTKADSYVRAVCFSPSGEYLVTGAEDHVVKVWDVRRRNVRHALVGHDTDIYSVDVSEDSRFIVSGSGDKKAKLWNLETGKLLATLGEEYGPTDGITSVCVSPTSQLVAAGSLDKVVRVWDVETNRLVRQLEGHRDSVYSVAFSPDGRMLLSGSLDKTLKLWDLTAQNQNSQCRLSFAGHKDFVLSVAFCPSGRFVISGSKDRTVQFWDPRHSTMALQLQGHRNSVISIAHNPRAQSLATGSGDCRARTWTYS